MHIFLSAAVALCLFSTSAKSETKTYKFHSTQTTQDGRTDATINGMSPQEFYKQFYYKEIQSEKSKWHVELSPGISELFERIPLEQGKFAQVSIFMFEDGTFEYQYDEWKGPREDRGVTISSLLYAKAGKGKWQIQGTELIFEGLGKATGGIFEEEKQDGTKVTQPILNFRFDKDIHRPGITEKILVLDCNLTSAAPGNYKDAEYDESVYGK